MDKVLSSHPIFLSCSLTPSLISHPASFVLGPCCDHWNFRLNYFFLSFAQSVAYIILYLLDPFLFTLNSVSYLITSSHLLPKKPHFNSMPHFFCLQKGLEFDYVYDWSCPGGVQSSMDQGWYLQGQTWSCSHPRNLILPATPETNQCYGGLSRQGQPWLALWRKLQWLFRTSLVTTLARISTTLNKESSAKDFFLRTHQECSTCAKHMNDQAK